MRLSRNRLWPLRPSAHGSQPNPQAFCSFWPGPTGNYFNNHTIDLTGLKLDLEAAETRG